VLLQLLVAGTAAPHSNAASSGSRTIDSRRDYAAALMPAIRRCVERRIPSSTELVLRRSVPRPQRRSMD